MSADVQAWLEAVVAAKLAGSRRVASITRLPFPHIGSYDCQRVVVAFETGEAIELFLKDYGHSRQSKDLPAARRNREIRVYRELLDGAGLGTPQLVGVLEAGERSLILLELVDADVVAAVDLRNGVAAVGWLARMHAHFLDRARDLAAADYLIRHDGDYFARKAAAAARDVASSAPGLASRSQAMLSRYERVTQDLIALPMSLVHGAFIPWHIFLDTRQSTERVCVVDWELAAYGSTLYDLAILVDDAPPALRTELCEAYLAAARLEGLPAPDTEQVSHAIDAIRLHRVVDWLSRSVEKSYTPDKIEWLIKRAESLA